MVYFSNFLLPTGPDGKGQSVVAPWKGSGPVNQPSAGNPKPTIGYGLKRRKTTNVRNQETRL